MKLTEFVVCQEVAEEFASFLSGLIRKGERNHVRIEIHSIDDPPTWSETPPRATGHGPRVEVVE
ncbi:MAG: hypothetical protein EB060_10865 [Proteobacteria bacterium]|nr:hypothetical protein [Pseudomonadota bacterium]